MKHKKKTRNKKWRVYSAWKAGCLRLGEHHGVVVKFDGDKDICCALFRKGGEPVAYLYAEWDGLDGYATDNSDNPMTTNMEKK